MDFPTTEPDIIALCTKMLAGYYWHAADFPKVNRSPLIAKRDIYITMKKRFAKYQAQLRIETKITNKKVSELVQVMKNCLYKSEVDTAGNPEKLKEIGWGVRTTPQAAQLPGQPTDLQLVDKEDKKVKLQWVRPAGNLSIRNYVIERRQQSGENFSDWSIFQIAYDTQITLRNQPIGIQLEYRIRAANIAGTGPFSNTVSVIL
jgi:hypothetical protein